MASHVARPSVRTQPSTSGVSYNDGTQFFVVSDTALVRNHEITLSSLSPLTTYHITVSSTDAVGNGPTLGGPVDGATKATPDTTAPVISNLQVTEIAETTALITWVTDERSDSAAAYGTAAGAPDNSKADIASVTEHRLTLTGLHDGTEDFLTVSSTDASANTGTSQRTTLPICTGSTSTWMILALGAKVAALPVTRSSNREPTLISRSQR